MSSVDDEPRAIAGILEGCLEHVLNANGRGREDVQLGSFNEEGFFRQSNRIPLLLAEQVEERSGGTHTVRPANSAIADFGTPFSGEANFVRCASDTPEGEVTHPTPDMVLFVINGHTKRLYINVPVRSQDLIDAELTRRQENILATRAAEQTLREEARARREAVDAEHAQLIAAMNQCVQESEDKKVADKWSLMTSRHSTHRGEITVLDLMVLCHMMGTTLATVVSTSLATAEATH